MQATDRKQKGSIIFNIYAYAIRTLAGVVIVSCLKYLDQYTKMKKRSKMLSVKTSDVRREKRILIHTIKYLFSNQVFSLIYQT